MGQFICGEKSTETIETRRNYGNRVIRDLQDRRQNSEKMLCDMETSMARATLKEDCDSASEVVIRLSGAPVVTLGGGKDLIEDNFLKKYQLLLLEYLIY